MFKVGVQRRSSLRLCFFHAISTILPFSILNERSLGRLGDAFFFFEFDLDEDIYTCYSNSFDYNYTSGQAGSVIPD